MEINKRYKQLTEKSDTKFMKDFLMFNFKEISLAGFKDSKEFLNKSNKMANRYIKNMGERGIAMDF